MEAPIRISPKVVTRSLGLVLTGGTVGSEITAQDTDRLVKLKHEQSPHGPDSALTLIRSSWSEADGIEYTVRRPVTLLSEDTVPQDWLTIAKACQELASNNVDGILILHGTDTMAYTASALSFMLKGIGLPVVLTGSNFPPNQPGSDALKNIHDALLSLQILNPGAYVTFAGGEELPGWVHLGSCVRKARASGQAFVSINREPVAKVVGDSVLFVEPLQHVTTPLQAKQDTTPFVIDDRVLSFRLYPGINLEAIRLVADKSRARGIVIELYPSGTGPAARSMMSVPKFVEDCVSSGMVVVAVINAAPEGTPNFYSSTIELRRRGATFIPDMLPETATVKLMWALAQGFDQASTANLMITPIAGETKGLIELDL